MSRSPLRSFRFRALPVALVAALASSILAVARTSGDDALSSIAESPSWTPPAGELSPPVRSALASSAPAPPTGMSEASARALFAPGAFADVPLPSASSGSDIADDQGAESFGKLGAWPYGPANATAFDSDRNLLFYGTGAAVRTLDLADPENPVFVSDAIETAGLVRAVTYDPENQNLILSEEKMGFEIWDVSDPLAPVLLSLTPVFTFGYQAPVLDVEVQDGYAYIAAEYGFFRIFDISDPANPVDFAYVEITGCREVIIDGSLIFVFGNDIGLFQITSPGLFSTLGVNFSENVWSGAERGNYAYAVKNGAINIYLLTDVFLPVVGSYSVPGLYFRDVAIYGQYLYACDAANGIHVADLATPTVPVAVGSFPDRGATLLESVGSRLYGTRGDNAFWLDLTAPMSPILLAEDTPPASSCYATATRDDGRIYATESRRGLFVIDSSDPGDPELLSETPLPGLSIDIELQGDLAYVASTYDGFQIVDVSAPGAPVPIGSHSVPGYARGIAVSGRYVYIADLFNGLIVYDAGDPTLPIEVGSLALPDGASRVTVRGDLAYCACGSDGLRIVDVSAPESPSLVGHLGGLDHTVGVALSGDYAYLADFGGGMRVVNVANPANPMLVSTFAPAGITGWGVSVNGNRAVLSAAEKQLYLLDVTNPAAPLILASPLTAGDAFEPDLRRSLLDLADGAAGIALYGDFDPAGVPATDLDARSLEVSVLARGDIARFRISGEVETLRVYDLEGRHVWTAPAVTGAEVQYAPARSGVYFWKASGRGLEKTGRFVTVR